MTSPETEVHAEHLGMFLPGPLRDWWRQAVQATEGELDRRRFASSYAAASRKAGREPVDAGDGRGERPLDHVLRGVLLARAVRLLEPDERAAFVHRLFETGDTREREALLGALVDLPDPERYLATATEACRTNVVSVFEAIACGNAYPERHFSEASFNQMVMKAVFLDVPVGGILGLEARRNPELARMARDYAAERRAAGRPVPDDAARLAGEETPAP